MFTRRREQSFILVGLIALNLWLGWSLGQRWKGYQSSTEWLEAAAPAEPSVKPALGHEQRGQLPNLHIVDRDVFSPLRGSAPLQPAEEAKAPRPPILFGTMNLGDGWFALMSAADQTAQAARRVLPGDDISGYKLVSIGVRSVVIEWQDKKTTLDISESSRRVPEVVDRTTAARPTSPVVTTTAAPNSGAPPRPFTGITNAFSKGPTPANADAPVGTVIDGQRKVLVPTLFGTAAVWVPAEQGAPAAAQQPQKK
jgi:hypothetical protein